jgi:hypothetical protein
MAPGDAALPHPEAQAGVARCLIAARPAGLERICLQALERRAAQASAPPACLERGG